MAIGILTNAHGVFRLHQATRHHAQFIWLLHECFLEPQRNLWPRLLTPGFLVVDQTKQLGMSSDVSVLKQVEERKVLVRIFQSAQFYPVGVREQYVLENTIRTIRSIVLNTNKLAYIED